MPPKKKLKTALVKVLAQAERKQIEALKNKSFDENRLRQKQNAFLKSNGVSKKALAAKAAKKHQQYEKEQERQQSITTDEVVAAMTPKPLVKFFDYDRILLIGEGNFSFASALVNQYYLGGAERLTATCFDSEQVLYEKYGDEAKENVELVRTMGGTVLFEVDGTKLDKIKAINRHKYSKIIFNFPHAGKGIKDEQRNIESNQSLLTEFFKSAAPLLSHAVTEGEDGKKQKKNIKDKTTDTKDNQYSYDHDERDDKKVEGEIYVTLKTGKPYDEWKVKFVAKWTGLLALKTSIPFRPSDYPGYAHRRTIGFKKGVSKEENEEIMKSAPRTFIFVRKQVMDAEIEKSKKGKLVAAKLKASGKKAKKRGRQEEGNDDDEN